MIARRLVVDVSHLIESCDALERDVVAQDDPALGQRLRVFVDALESKVDRLERLCREGEAAGVVSADQRRAFARKVAQLQAFVQRRVRAVALRSGTAAPDDAAIAGAVRQVSSPTAFVASHTTPAPLEPIAVPDLAEPELAVAGPRARSSASHSTPEARASSRADLEDRYAEQRKRLLARRESTGASASAPRGSSTRADDAVVARELAAQDAIATDMVGLAQELHSSARSMADALKGDTVLEETGSLLEANQRLTARASESIERLLSHVNLSSLPCVIVTVIVVLATFVGTVLFMRIVGPPKR